MRTPHGVYAELHKLENTLAATLFSHLAHDDGRAITLSQNGYGAKMATEPKWPRSQNGYGLAKVATD